MYEVKKFFNKSPEISE